MAKVRCQRIGCDAMFSEDDNPDGSCTYHDAANLPMSKTNNITIPFPSQYFTMDERMELLQEKESRFQFVSGNSWMKILPMFSGPQTVTIQVTLFFVAGHTDVSVLVRLILSNKSHVHVCKPSGFISERGFPAFELVKFSLWCKTGKHTTEKPVLAKAAAAPKLPVSTPTPTTNLSSKDTCSRCRQGFFCSDHGMVYTYLRYD
ncbi:Cysteine and histidine-rich domain-containing protein RAR1 [Sesamum angolense]|uniref:Cysteine and histidine-rich domain-containing protein RAR1 n=1 Tax=Sesamum angolense TaxID=2727404 RepID=A0AAE1X1K0_9LAMI|nr:Cysteine and histidine-rich domain-containing protein RAR1 [Sesamum angolense]